LDEGYQHLNFGDFIDEDSREFLDDILCRSKLNTKEKASKTIKFLLNTSHSPMPPQAVTCKITRVFLRNFKNHCGEVSPIYGYVVKARFSSPKSTEELRERIQERQRVTSFMGLG